MGDDKPSTEHGTNANKPKHGWGAMERKMGLDTKEEKQHNRGQKT